MAKVMKRQKFSFNKIISILLLENELKQGQVVQSWVKIRQG